jgi:hypothetical protein
VVSLSPSASGGISLRSNNLPCGDPKDDRVVDLNYLLLVPAEVTLQSSAVVTGPYADEPTATVNVNAQTVSIAAAGAPRLYRLEAAVPVKVSSISVTGGLVTLKY